MKLRMTGDLEASINLVANETGKPGNDLIGFVIAEYSSNESTWYANWAYKTKNFYAIIIGEGAFKKIKDFLELNKDTLRLFPLVYARSCVIPDNTKGFLRELAKEGYDAAVVAGFCTELYRVDENDRWGITEFVDLLPPKACNLSTSFVKLYLSVEPTEAQPVN
jgi:hypothetical protein